MADEYREEPTESQEPTAGGAPSHADVEMGEDGEGAAENADASELPFAEGGEDQPEVEKRIEFIDYLKSPMVTLLVGDGDKSAILTAHQALLQQSPYFAEACSAFDDDGSASLPWSRSQLCEKPQGWKDGAANLRTTAPTD